MKVCMSHNFGITPRFGGGIASVILNVVNETKDKIDYTLVTSYNKKDLDDARTIYGPEVKIVNIETKNDYATDFLSYLLRIPIANFDIVHFHDLPLGRTLPLAFRSYIKKLHPIFSYHYDQSYQTHYPFSYGIGGGYYHFFLKKSYRFWKKIIVNSKATLNDFSHNWDYLSKVRLIPNGVNIAEVQKARPMTIVGDPALLHVGHLEVAKGVDILLHAFSELVESHSLPDPHLHMVGDGALISYCREFVNKKGLNCKVHFWGAQSHDAVFRFMKSCDIFVFPSRYEGFGVVVLEAMAAEKPIISTSVGGVPDILTHRRNALLIKPRPDELMNAIVSLGQDLDLASQFSKNNKNDVKLFSWKKISEEYIALYREVLTD